MCLDCGPCSSSAREACPLRRRHQRSITISSKPAGCVDMSTAVAASAASDLTLLLGNFACLLGHVFYDEWSRIREPEAQR